jgi:hypothetical protein
MHGGVSSRLEKTGRETVRARAERKKEQAFLREMRELSEKLTQIGNTAHNHV